MTVVERLTRWSQRFLSSRSFDLIAAPALADLEHEGATTLTGWLAAARAIAGAIGDDLAGNLGQVALFAGLTLMPAAYYLLLFLLCAPMRVTFDSTTRDLIGLVLLLSAAPALACYWPEPLPPPPSTRHEP